MEKAKKEFIYNRFLCNFYLFGAIIFLFINVGLPMLLNRSNGVFRGIPIIVVLLIFSFVFRNMKVLKIFEEHCEIKVAIGRSIKFVTYKNIKELKRHKYKAVLWLHEGRKVKMPLSLFNKHEREDVINIFETMGIPVVMT